MNEELTEDQLAARFKNRRRMAWWSFGLLAVFGGMLIASGVNSDAIAARLDKMFPVITLVMGTWVSIILAYYGAAAYEHTR